MKTPTHAPGTAPQAAYGKTEPVTVKNFVTYSEAVMGSDSPAGYKVAAKKLVDEAVEKDRLGEKPDLDVLRKALAAAAKAEGMPEKPVIPVP